MAENNDFASLIKRIEDLEKQVKELERYRLEHERLIDALERELDRGFRVVRN